MSYVLARPSSVQRSSLLGIVVALHLALLAIILTARAVAPQIMATPLIVDLLQAPEAEKEPEVKPLPVARAPVQRQKPIPAHKTPVPLLETSSSSVPSAAAPVFEPADSKPSTSTHASEATSQARFDADYLRNPAPPYPALSKRMGEEGKVILRVSVTPHGSADSVEVKTSSGSPRLDESARKTVQNWKFIPAKRGETAVQSWVLVPIIFKLEQ
jgi:periplasmic protein TonB